MAHLISAVVASAMLGVVSVPIAQLSVTSMQTRARSQLYHDAEQLALGVRKATANASELEISNGGLLLDGQAYNLPSGCSVTASNDIGKVTCTSSRGNGGLTASNSQPLYTSSDLQGNANQNPSSLCWSSHQSQHARITTRQARRISPISPRSTTTSSSQATAAASCSPRPSGLSTQRRHQSAV